MNDVKWIKINTDIFDDEKFSIIDGMPESDAIELIWFKLLVFAGKSNNNGIFFFNDKVAYTDEMLAYIFRRPLNTVRLALKTFIDLGMIEEIEGVYTIPNWNKHQSISSVYEKKKEYDREYQRKRRETNKNLIEEKKSYDSSTTIVRDCSISYSYSFNSNKNTNNFIHILEDTDYLNKEYIKNNKRLYDCIYGWLDYKDNKKPKSQNHYNSERGLTTLLNMFVSKEKEYGIAEVERVVNETMGNNYQGIIWDKLKKTSKPSFGGGLGNVDVSKINW